MRRTLSLVGNFFGISLFNVRGGSAVLLADFDSDFDNDFA